MRPLLLLCLFAAPVFADFPAIGVPADAPVSSYPEPRAYEQSHSWWTPADEGLGVGSHVHFETAFPTGQTVKGKVRLDVRIRLHEMPAGSKVTSILIRTPSTTLFDSNKWLQPDGKVVNYPDLLPDDHGNLDHWLAFPVFLDTTKLPDGWRELRCTAKVRRPDERTSSTTDFTDQFQSTGWMINVANGKSLKSPDRPFYFHEARGWYDDYGYANARAWAVKDKVPFPIPQFPISEDFTIHVEAQAPSGDKITHHIVTINPDFHHGDPGIVLLEGTGPLKKDLVIPVSILPPGNHRIAVISRQHQSAGTNTGVLVVPIEVAE